MKRFLLFTASLGVALLAGEIFFRTTGRDMRLMNSDLKYQGIDFEVMRESPDRFLHYELAPNTSRNYDVEGSPPYHVHIDQNGARFPAHNSAKPDGTFRILFFGASTTYGANVSDEDTIPATLEAQLNAVAVEATSGPKRFEVWNFAAHAYVLAQVAHRARVEMPKFSPDLILLQLHNTGPRAFLRVGGWDPVDTLQHYADDPNVIPEYFPPPWWIPDALHFAAIRYSAVYRSITGLHRRYDRFNVEFADELGRKEAESLMQEARARHVPVAFVGLPTNPNRTNPIIPDAPYVSLAEEGHPPQFYLLHPPAPFLKDVSAVLINRLRSIGMLPAKGGL